MARGAWCMALKRILGTFWSTRFCTIFRGFSGVLGVMAYDLPPPLTLVPTENMATIRARKKADGTVIHTVRIRLKKKGALVYQECQTFARQQAAQA
ncbi:hypothetical protein WR25_00514 [Diploscapter pachys]|uniref:Uncharacterized protein n=1 Tax=Diploscapter pachys TaxID=2018661 RepID=A0A2A2KL87_9BILA|nr:hypothetical protein WR25_00514 [Diploscapter pachys]